MEVPEEVRRAILDEEHLRLLRLAHYIVGGLEILFASMFIFHFAMFFVFGTMPGIFPPAKPGHEGPPREMFQVMAAVIGLFIVAGWTFGGLTIYAGRCIRRRTRRGLGLVVACVSLLFVPVGTIFGVASIMVLSRESVKRLFAQPATPLP